MDNIARWKKQRNAENASPSVRNPDLVEGMATAEDATESYKARGSMLGSESRVDISKAAEKARRKLSAKWSETKTLKCPQLRAGGAGGQSYFRRPATREMRICGREHSNKDVGR